MSLSIRLEAKNRGKEEPSYDIALRDMLVVRSVNGTEPYRYNFRQRDSMPLEFINYYHLFGDQKTDITLATVHNEIKSDKPCVLKDENDFCTYIFGIRSIEYYYHNREAGTRHLAATLSRRSPKSNDAVLNIPTNEEIDMVKSSKRFNVYSVSTPLTKFDWDIIHQVYRNVVKSVMYGFYLDSDKYGGEQNDEMHKAVEDIYKYIRPKGVSWLFRFANSIRLPFNFEKKTLKGRI